MHTVWIISYVVLWAFVLLLGFLLLGALRAVGHLEWQLEQVQATTPSRIGRNGLKPGRKAPEFALPSAAGGEVRLEDFAGCKVLLVFTQSGCAPCHRVMPDLARLQGGGDIDVLVVNNGEAEATRQWADEVQAPFPILIQERFEVSRRYEAFATPFAFLINERGVIESAGIINNSRHIRFVLSIAATHAAGESQGAEASFPGTGVPKDRLPVSS